jgi:hypothetical protein
MAAANASDSGDVAVAACVTGGAAVGAASASTASAATSTVTAMGSEAQLELIRRRMAKLKAGAGAL